MSPQQLEEMELTAEQVAEIKEKAIAMCEALAITFEGVAERLNKAIVIVAEALREASQNFDAEIDKELPTESIEENNSI